MKLKGCTVVFLRCLTGLFRVRVRESGESFVNRMSDDFVSGFLKDSR